MLARLITFLLLALTLNALAGAVQASPRLDCAFVLAGAVAAADETADPKSPALGDSPSNDTSAMGEAHTATDPHDVSTALDDPSLPPIDNTWLLALRRHAPPRPLATVVRPDPEIEGLLRPPRA